jgi:hypothetical protein
MWSKTVNRTELAEILNSGRLSPGGGLTPLDPNELAAAGDIELLWNKDPVKYKVMPSAIIVDTRKQTDLFAWMNTYVPSIRPITAYCRVADRQSAKMFLSLTAPPWLDKVEGACLGMIVGEAATYVADRRELREISHASCLSTLSYSLARAAALGLERRLVSQVEERWFRTRGIIGAVSLPIGPNHIECAWSVLGHLSGGRFELSSREPVPDSVLEACSQILTIGGIEDSTWAELTRELPELGPLIRDLSGPREGRLALLEMAVKSLPRVSRKGNLKLEFLCGFLASCISPGTLDHLSVLSQYLESIPSLFVWYGLCAGLWSNDSLGSQATGLFRRVKRELLREDHFLQSPSCDISFAEIEVLSESAREWTDIRTSTTGLLVVELLPCVNSHFRLRRAESNSDIPSPRAASLLDEISHSLQLALQRIDRLRRAAGIGQAGTFDFDKGKKGRP